MQIQINSDNIIELGEAACDALCATVADHLSRFEGRLTRVEVHFSDINGDSNKTGNDKHCNLEARAAGREPLAVSNEAATVDSALGGALHKLVTALERDIGRITSRKGH